MKIKNIEIDFNFLDADNVEKFENEAKKVIEKTKNEKQIDNMSYAEALRLECNIVEDFIDNVFGKGISKEIFEGKKDLLEHIKIFQEIVDEKNKKQKELEDMYKKYAPRKKKNE